MDLSSIWSSYEELNDLVYAADMDTYDVIYMNRKGKERLGITSSDQLKGKKCYEVIMGNSAPCTNCTNPKIINGGVHDLEFFNTKLNSVFKIRDQMIESNGRRIRIETASEIFENQNHLSLEKSDEVLLLVSECIRLALEHKDLDKGLKELIEYLGRTTLSKRAYIFELNEKKQWNNTYEWCAKGTKPQIESLKDIPFETTRIWNKQFYDKQFVAIGDVDAIQDRDPEVYDYLVPQDIHSIIVGPLYRADQLCGFFGLDNPPIEMMEQVVCILDTIRHVISVLIEKRDLQSSFHQLSYRNALSYLKNRNDALEYIRQLNPDQSMGVLLCDLCSLKKVNEEFGHSAGDNLLLQTNDILKEVFDKYDIFRWSGDQMLILASAMGEYDFLRRTQQVQKMAQDQYVPLAFGLIWKSRIDNDVLNMIQEANMHMYKSKSTLYESFDIDKILENNQKLK